MAQPVERKLTTILCADACGYSRLMEEDEAGTLATLSLCREAIDGLIGRHRGRIVSTAGDSLLAEFPSVVEAVQCAIEIQQDLGGRNRACPAEAGGICISRPVYDQVRNRLAVGFDDLGDQPVKNISLPVQAFRVRLDGAKDSREPASPRRPPSSQPASDPIWKSRRLRRRALQAAFLIALLAVINLATSPGYLWFLWAALYLVAHLAWDALKQYDPETDRRG